MDKTTELYLPSGEAMAYLEHRLGREVKRPTFLHWVKKGAFPNLQSSGEGHARRIAIPVSDLDAFDPESIKEPTGRKANPDAPWHGYRDLDGKEQWELQRRRRRQKRNKE